ncbi:hypothetical protein MBM_07913 [Drepanopeziza brunnea f. sp. 'multigermtubi' MB_m1]|uniref:Uncharacterized protein n=1 Tax=Marssonina brunnea f. sp. multigermtubi (strain MB_m1) TaxID=1072389 RepID=K1WN16_MARBU|nr:uncharacterized protein MBM_07913 [Drepanopeziza brunnea f. sp. 'multigermtubi' MB_m1]EKD13712.1 hypothetical protein MBM_07913 [Drepanopeziza brunnea f. sp. 'multigermtubi' MB_m1]
MHSIQDSHTIPGTAEQQVQVDNSSEPKCNEQYTGPRDSRASRREVAGHECRDEGRSVILLEAKRIRHPKERNAKNAKNATLEGCSAGVTRLPAPTARGVFAIRSMVTLTLLTEALTRGVDSHHVVDGQTANITSQGINCIEPTWLGRGGLIYSPAI